MSDNRDPGYFGLLQLGYTPEQAWTVIRDAVVVSPDTARLFRFMASTSDGQTALEISRRQRAERGFPPPWAELLEGDPDA